jgi:mannonate dehydratase
MSDSATAGRDGRAEIEELPMRVGLGQFKHPTRERLRFVSQLGVTDVQLNMYHLDPSDGEALPLSGREEWSFRELVQLRNRIEDAGLRLTAIENLPAYFYDDVVLGREGREEQLEHVKTTIRNLGKAGIPYLGYNWMPNGVWRTSRSRPVRGGAEATAFDLEDVRDAPNTHGRTYTEEEMWENYEYFLEEVLPVAEEAGVRLCVHPDDPPVDSLGGIPRLFRNFENYKRAMDLVESDNHGVEFCLGTFSEMDHDADLLDVIRYFGERDEIFYVHFRDVEGTVPEFHEVFVDEGNFDEYEVIRALDDVGFSGMMLTDHVPIVDGDTEWGHRGRAYTAGYLNGMLKSLDG